MKHLNARCEFYPTPDGSLIKKVNIPDSVVSWETNLEGYNPPCYSFPCRDSCDQFSEIENIHFNCIDGNINRVSHLGNYAISDGLPLNPMGRTGISGRGRLPRFGPNHAADCIVTRWKLDTDGSFVKINLKPVLEFIAITRKDNRMLALPGGKQNPGEALSETFLREFMEETLESWDPPEESDLYKSLKTLFSFGETLFEGYVDDPRNTDNAWMETVVKDFHDNTGNIVGRLPLKAGDDAQAVDWFPISSELKLFASHLKFLRILVTKHDAHW